MLMFERDLACLASQQHAGVSQGWICARCHTKKEASDQIFCLTHSQYTDIRPTSPSADPECQAPGRVATGEPIFKSLE